METAYFLPRSSSWTKARVRFSWASFPKLWLSLHVNAFRKGPTLAFLLCSKASVGPTFFRLHSDLITPAGKFSIFGCVATRWQTTMRTCFWSIAALCLTIWTRKTAAKNMVNTWQQEWYSDSKLHLLSWIVRLWKNVVWNQCTTI